MIIGGRIWLIIRLEDVPELDIRYQQQHPWNKCKEEPDNAPKDQPIRSDLEFALVDVIEELPLQEVEHDEICYPTC